MTEASLSRDPPATASERFPPTAGPLEPAFPAWGLAWRWIVSWLGVLTVVGAPWAGLWFYRWCAERIALPGGGRLRLDADVRGAWPLFVATGLAGWLEDGLADALDRPSRLVISVLIEAALWAWLVKWLIPRLRVDESRLGFEGSFLGLAAWTVLFYLGVVSLIGWAWALKNMLRWTADRVAGPVAVEFCGSGARILGRTALLLVACLPVVTIPWALARWMNWMVSQFEVRPRPGE
ncbi:hypothetical protein DFR50_11442 [Roseiarcus fermentans]|uniref:Uncharacterized protein n=1 Tax=Roseiarcus fermentans TaxID=1473586 RepID=A0A366FC15_9HYPH|nr:hypothetical protein [Roseiarcus fermentans]RBP12213.1 hypothetical protein DFR50_11442 [Roseiarcus fermentans]